MRVPPSASPGSHAFAEVARDEIWQFRQSGFVCVERRLDEGCCIIRDGSETAVKASSDLAFLADTAVVARDLPTRLRRATTFSSRDLIERMRARRAAGLASVRIRTVARWIDRGAAGTERVRTTIGIDRVQPTQTISVIASPETLDEDLELFSAIHVEPRTAAEPRAVPILWTNGTGAVLLHEAIGHPSITGASPVAWPDWLEVIDEPAIDGLGRLEVDDAGLCPTRAILTARGRPSSWRRESWRDVPARRMSNLVVRATRWGRVRPPTRIEVQFVRGGAWDPLTDVVTIEVAFAELVEGSRRLPVVPFTIRESRARIAACLESARGRAIRYPGVLCHDEGQRLPVGSFAPDILTRPFAKP